MNIRGHYVLKMTRSYLTTLLSLVLPSGSGLLAVVAPRLGGLVPTLTGLGLNQALHILNL